MTQTAKILIVEDEVIVAMEIQDLLESRGYAVCGIAASGAGAVEKAARDQPDLILMDVTLRGEMTGIDAAERILASRRIPLIFLTAAVRPEAVRRIQALTYCDFLSKPFEEDALVLAVDRALREAGD
jgi:CheY-like chemotaxis protein